jgi:CheY-like chemotaxis protein
MNAETLEHLFQPFFTTKPVGKGTGLGLATVFGIVKQSGGFIFPESEVGKGTVFKIYFPSVAAKAEPTAVPRSHVAKKQAATILLVEDEPAFRDLLTEGLEAAGYRVLVGENGVDALHVASQFAEPIELLLTDVIMPQMNGPDLAKYVKDVHPEAKVLYISGYTDDKLQLISSDADVALLQKPFYMHDLLRKMQQLLQQRAQAQHR